MIRNVRHTGRLTLRDVIVHMEHMEQRLSARIDHLSVRVDKNEIAIRTLGQRLTGRIDLLERNLTTRMDALEEDLTATMQDTVKIRRHVGMTVVEE